MIHPIKIIIKGYPYKNEVTDEFYNKNDLMTPITIFINDFPIFISENFELKYMGFYHFSKAKLKINVKPTSAIYFKESGFKASASSIMKIKSSFVIKLKFNQYASSYIKLFGFGNSNSSHNAKIVDTKINQKGTMMSKIKTGGIRIIADKCYLIKADKLLGYWDDYTLDEMDILENLEIGGTIVG